MTTTPYDLLLAEIRAVRKARKLSQGSVARSIKISRAQYTAIENGRSVVNYTHLHNLSVVLGVRFVIGDPASPLASRYSAE